MEKHIKVPMTREEAKQLKAGDYVYLTGTIYTARDAATNGCRKRLQQEKSCRFQSTEQLFTIWDRPRRGREDRSVLQDRQPRAEWISMRLSFWIWDFSA